MIGIIDSAGNNLNSLMNALKRLGKEYLLTSDPKRLAQCSQLILPGVGTANAGMAALRQCGLDDFLNRTAQPILGICLGMQLLLDSSAEGGTECLGLIPGKALALEPKPDYPVPHMGWNQLQWQLSTFLKEGIEPEDYVYFVHSYALVDSKFCLASCRHSDTFSAIIRKDNLVGMQFHPEKSGRVGLQLLSNFLNDKSV